MERPWVPLERHFLFVGGCVGGCTLSPDRGRTDCGHLWPDIFAPVVVVSLLFAFLLRDGFDSPECHFFAFARFFLRSREEHQKVYLDTGPSMNIDQDIFLYVPACRAPPLRAPECLSW